MTQPLPARELRVSDDERRHVVGLLERATGRGLLDLDEFSSRVDTALAARTRAELNVLLLDLPGLVHPDGRVHPTGPNPRPTPARPAAAGAAAADGAAAGAADGTLLRAELGPLKRRGRWEVPARLRVEVILGSAELDFTEAEIAHPVVRIEISVTTGSLELRLPEDARLERDGVQAVLGNVNERWRGSTGGSGTLFVLSGAVRMGSVEVKGPRRKRRWHH